MKKQLILCLMVCLATGGSSMAANKKWTASPTAVIRAYIDSFRTSDPFIFNEIMDDAAYIATPRQGQVIRHSKSQILQFYKKEKNGNVLGCAATHKIITMTDALVMVAVDFKFANFIQRNYMTIEKNKDDEWKVMSVNRVFI